VKLSYYEIYITSLRACSAMGFPYGLDEDAANIITWLEFNNLNGIEKLAKITKDTCNIKRKINLENIKISKTINLNKSSLLYNGPGLFDYLYEKMKRNKTSSIYLKNCKDPEFILPLITKFLKKHNSIKINFFKKSINRKTFYISKKKILISESNNKSYTLNNYCTIQFYKQIKKNPSSEKIINNINYEIKDSVTPNLKYWNIVAKKANETFVPATKSSRDKGAGGGDDND